MIKKLIKSIVARCLGLIGYSAVFFKNKKASVIPVDKFIWEPFFRPDERMKLYYEGLKQAKVEWSNNFPKECRFYSLEQLVEFAVRQGFFGDFAECGCWKGHSSYIISSILSKNNFKGEFHIFDSFEGGLSDKSLEDKNLRFNHSREDTLKESRVFFSTQEEVKTCLSGFWFVRMYKGWIPERFEEVKDKRFAFVHIDVDLYQPTLDSLIFFYPRLIKGGCIVVDDYGFCQFPGAKKAVDRFLKENSCYIFYEIPMGGCFLVK